MVRASMPYFQTTDPSRITNDFSPAFSNLYSQKQGESNPKVSVRNAARVLQQVQNLVASRSMHNASVAARTVSNALEAENSSIVLVREMTGFPLQFYAHLDTLRRAYETTRTTGSLKSDAAHINYHEARRTCPTSP